MKMSTARRQRGLTLVELMIALTLDLVIIAAVVGLFLQSSKYRNDVERANVQIENGRYAMQVLTDDLQMAGYYGQLNVGNMSAGMTGYVAQPNPCGTSSVDLDPGGPTVPKPFLVPLQAYDGGSALSCISDLKTGTDVVVIRRASYCIRGAVDCPDVPGAMYFQASSCSTDGNLELASSDQTNHYRLSRDLSRLNRRAFNCGTLAEIRQFLVRIYFIANNDIAGDGIPTLKRAELGAGGFTIIPIANGIEDLQLEYGLDTNSDTVPDAFTPDPYTFGGCGGDVCGMANTMGIVAANVHLLARSLTKRNNFTDTKTYTLGLTVGGVPVTVGPFGDGYERHVFEGSARLMNPSLRQNPNI